MSRGPVKFVWRGMETVRQVQRNLEDAYTEFGLRVEGASKKKLKKGHGVRYGTLRRSIHLADPSYNWQQDNVGEGKSGPERGGKPVKAKTIGSRTSLLIGSGLIYSLAIHQGWPLGYKDMRGSFEGYHYLTEGLETTKPELPAILEKHRMKK